MRNNLCALTAVAACESHAATVCNFLSSKRPAYIFLLSVLFIMAIAISIVGSYLLLSIASLQNGMALEQASQSLELASTCAERAFISLLDDNAYAGDEEITFPEGSCFIYPVGGFGNENRTLCAEGISGQHTRRIEIILSRILPSIQVYSWREVAEITACESP